MSIAVCTIGILALSLFQRFHIAEEPFPDTSVAENWYRIKVTPSPAKPGEFTNEYKYPSHAAAVKRALSAVGLNSKAVTHAGRGSGARLAELSGASEEQIRRMGRWNNKVMEGCYLTSLPIDGIISHAGFGQNPYQLPRAAVEPLEELKKMLFPEIDDALKYQETGPNPNLAAGT